MDLITKSLLIILNCTCYHRKTKASTLREIYFVEIDIKQAHYQTATYMSLLHPKPIELILCKVTLSSSSLSFSRFMFWVKACLKYLLYLLYWLFFSNINGKKNEETKTSSLVMVPIWTKPVHDVMLKSTRCNCVGINIYFSFITYYQRSELWET